MTTYAELVRRGEFNGVEVVPWSEFLPTLTPTTDGNGWQAGQHVSIIGPTGSGKSVLTQQLLPLRRTVAVLGTKPHDATLDRLISHEGYTRVRDWPPSLPWHRKPKTADWWQRVILWPPYRGTADRAVQRDVFDRALGEMFAAGKWCVNVDEAYYLCHTLGLAPWLEDYWTQGRSSGLSLVAATQRPAWVPLFMYDQATHLFFFADNDETNLRRVGGLGGLSARTVRDTVAALPEHSVLYVNTRRRRLAVTRVE